MTIVTLTTDFGHKDYSIAVIKAALLNYIPKAIIIDISHEITPYNHSETAYILKNSFSTFPKGSIHIIGVESELTPGIFILLWNLKDTFSLELTTVFFR